MSTQNFAPTIQALLESIYTVRGKRESRCPIRASALGACPRALSAQMCGVNVRDFNARTMRIFEMGTGRGRDLALAITEALNLPAQEACNRLRAESEAELWISTLVTGDNAFDALVGATERWGEKDLPLRVCYDQPSKGAELQIRGRCDVALFEIDGVHIIDFKTKGSYGFDKLDEEGPGHENVIQIAGYAAGFRRQGLHVLSSTLVYENKDTSELKAMPVDVDSASVAVPFANAIGSISSLLLRLGAGELSAVDGVAVYAAEAAQRGGRLPWNCNYCSVGPIEGGCVPADKLVNKAKDGAITKWEVRL